MSAVWRAEQMESRSGRRCQQADIRLRCWAAVWTSAVSYTHLDVYKRQTREWNDIAAEHNQNIAVVPQILTNQAEGFCKVAGMLKEQGYEEVNLNLGCPSATVTAKKKGAGFLADPDALDAFLEEIFAHSPLKISIKTRIGVENPDEFERLLDIFSQYPIQKLIVHPRVLKEFYKGNVHREAYVQAKERLSAAAADVETVGWAIPVCYNGDLFSVSDTERFLVERCV